MIQLLRFEIGQMYPKIVFFLIYSFLFNIFILKVNITFTETLKQILSIED